MAADIATQVQQVISALNHVASAAWTSLVQQQYLNGIGEAVLSGVFLILLVISSVVLARCATRLWQSYQPANFVTRIREKSYSRDTYEIRARDEDSDRYYAPATISAALMVASSIVLLCCAADSIQHIVDPAAYAINNIIGR